MEWIPTWEAKLLRSLLDVVRPITLCSSLLMVASGCTGWRQSTATDGGLSAMFRPKISRVSYEEELEEIPEEPQDPVRLKLAYARWMEEVNQPHEARDNYNSVINKQPKNVEALLGLGRLDILAGSYQEAERHFLQAVKLAPENPEAQYELGRYYASQNRWQESIAPLNKAMLNDPLTKQYRHQLAIAQVHVGDISSAIPNFSQTVGDAESHYNVALILKDLGNLPEAEHQLVMALTKQPNLESAQQWLIEVRRQRGTVAHTNGFPASGTPGDIQQTAGSAPAGHSVGQVMTAGHSTRASRALSDAPPYTPPQRGVARR